MIDDRPHSQVAEPAGAPVETRIRTTLVAVDITQMVVSILVVVTYGVALVYRGTVPSELSSLVFVVVGAVVAKKLPS